MPANRIAAFGCIYWFKSNDFSFSQNVISNALEPEKHLDGTFLFAGMARSHKNSQPFTGAVNLRKLCGMWYVIYSRDRENALEARLAARPAHIERVNAMVADGRILVAGPRPAIDSPDPGPAGMEGSLIVADFDSLEEAKEWAETDPYVLAGVYESVEVSPFIKVLP